MYVTSSGSRPLCMTEVQAIMSACDSERDRALISLAVTSGLRARELLALTVDAIYDGVRVRDFVTLCKEHAKGKKRGRRQPLTPQCRTAVWRHLEAAHLLRDRQDAQLFDLTYWGFRWIFNGLVERSGIDAEGVTLHSLRKAGAAAVCSVGGLQSAQGFLGHSSGSTTLRYIGAVTDDALAVVVSSAIKV